MKKIIDFITEELRNAFEEAGYDPAYAKVSFRTQSVWTR